MVGGLRFESVRGLCKSPVKVIPVQVDLQMLQCAADMEPFMELSGREVCTRPVTTAVVVARGETVRPLPVRDAGRVDRDVDIGLEPGKTLPCNRGHSRSDTVGEGPGSAAQPLPASVILLTHSPA